MAALDVDILTRARQLAQDLRRQSRDDDAQVVDALIQAVSEQVESTSGAQDTPQYLTTGKVGRRLGVSRQTVVNWVKQGLLPGVRMGSRLMVPATAMSRFARLERILDDLDAEREPGKPAEIVELVAQGREHWTRPGKDA
jgi:excisionase family DNA binding protein